MFRMNFCAKAWAILAPIRRNFVKCEPLFSKTFTENENEYAYSVITKSLASKHGHHHQQGWFKVPTPSTGHIDIASSVPKSQGAASPNQVFHEFLTATNEVKGTQRTIEDPVFDPLVDGVVNALPEFSDLQLSELVCRLNDWPTTDSTKSPNFVILWNSLDSQCTARCGQWSNDQMLYVAGLWFNLKLSRITKFNRKMLSILSDRLDQLDVETLVGMLFYVNLQRKVSARFMTAVEEKLLQDIEKLSLNQIAVASMAFFKTKTQIKSYHLIREIVSRTESEMADADPISLVALFKSLRYSSSVGLQEIYENLQRNCVPHVAQFNSTVIMHATLLCISELICAPELLDQMMLKFGEDLQTVRLKDMSRSMFLLAMFAPDRCVDYARLVAENARTSSERQAEIKLYPGATISLALCLAYVGVYEPHLINICLSRSYLDMALVTKEDVDVQREAFVLDCCVGLECPEYTGSRLSKDNRHDIFTTKHFTKHNRPTHISVLTADVKERLSTIIGGANYCHQCHILPHFQHQDLLLIVKKGGGFKPIPDSVKRTSLGSIIVPPANENWLAVVIGGRAFYNRRTKSPLGPSRMKIRHLQRLGYTVIEIPWFSYDYLHGTERDLDLQKKISSFL